MSLAFIVRIYHNARSSECQNPCTCLCCNVTVNRRTYSQLRQDIFLSSWLRFLFTQKKKENM